MNIENFDKIHMEKNHFTEEEFWMTTIYIVQRKPQRI